MGPRHGPVQSPVHLEHAGPVAESAERGDVPRRQRASADGDQLAGRDVEDRDAGRRQVAQPRHRAAGPDLATQRPEVAGERGREGLRAAGGHRPPEGVGGHPEHQGEARRRRGAQGEHGVGGAAGQERACLLVTVARLGERGRGADAAESEPGQDQRVPGQVRRRQHLVEQRPGVSHQRLPQPAVGRGVPPEAGRGLAQVPVGDRGPTAVQRVREGDRRVGEPQPVRRQRHRPDHRRRQREGVDGGAHVVGEARQRELGGAHAAARAGGRLADHDRQAVSGQGDRGRQAVRPRTHDHRVVARVPEWKPSFPSHLQVSRPCLPAPRKAEKEPSRSA